MSQYNKEFKLSAVRLALRDGKKVAQAARELNINANTLHGWIAKYKDLVPEGSTVQDTTNTAKLLEELQQAKKKIANLEEERAILVKAAAFFAKESSNDTRS